MRFSYGEYTLLRRVSGFLGIVALLSLVLYFSPLDTGYNWFTFTAATQRLMTGQPLYVNTPDTDPFLNPPHTLLMLLPLTVLPSRIGWSLLCVFTVLTIIAVGRLWQFDPLKIVLSLTSVPLIITLAQGNIDGLALMVLLVPPQYQLPFILAKPQVLGGLGVRTIRYWQAWLMGSLIALLALIFRYQDSFAFANEIFGAKHNLWLGLRFPLQLICGVACLGQGIIKNDEKLLLFASPFLSPYATFTHLLVLWMVACAWLNRWVAFAVWIALWLALGYARL